MNCVYTFGTGRHKRQADITLLFQYICIPVILIYLSLASLNVEKVIFGLFFFSLTFIVTYVVPEDWKGLATFTLRAASQINLLNFKLPRVLHYKI